MKSTCILSFLIIAVITICLALSCTQNHERMPQELIDIDSALTRGDYRKGQILLEEYEDQHPQAKSDEIAMYHKLMRAFLRYRVGKERNGIRQMDSLCNYYKQHGLQKELALSLLISGDAYRNLKAYPEALACCLQAETTANEIGDLNILCFTYRQEGCIYYEQLMYDEAQNYFRKHYALAEKLGNIRQMIMGSHEMGFVYTYKNEADSAIWTYKKSIELAKYRNDSDLYISLTKARLYDIYIQLEEYDSVKNIMPRDSMNFDNWSYYYKGIGNIDSAIYYFHKSLNNYNIVTDRRCLRELIGLEKSRGNLREVVSLHEQLKIAEDSIQKQNRETETERTQARYDYEQLKQERDMLARKQERYRTYMWFGLGLLLLLGVIVYLYVKNQWKAKEAELAREKLRRKEEEGKRKISEAQLAENQRQHAQLLQQQAEAAARNDGGTQRLLQVEANLLEAENQLIETRQEKQRLLLLKLQESDLYRCIRQNAGNSNFHLTLAEWQQLAESLDETYDNLTQRVQNLANLNITELRTVYLIKLGLQPADMANLLCKSKSAISMLRVRMYEKIFGKRGTAIELDNYIRDF